MELLRVGIHMNAVNQEGANECSNQLLSTLVESQKNKCVQSMSR